MYALFFFVLMICWQTPAVPSRTPKINNPKSKHETKNGPTATPSPTPIASPAAPISQPTPSPQKDGNKEKTKGKPYPVDVVHQPFDVLMLCYVLVTAMAAFLALGTLIELKKQVRSARRQIVEMRKTRIHTVREMQGASAQTQQMLGHMKTQVVHLETLADATKQNAEAAKDNANSARLSAESLKGSQRAHLDWEMHIVTGSKYSFRVINYGVSMARIVKYALLRATFDMPLKELPDSWVQSIEPANVDMTLPKGGNGAILEFDAAHYLSDEHRGGTKTAIFGVRVEFLDIFKDRHFIEIVFVYRHGSGALENLPQYNRYE